MKEHGNWIAARRGDDFMPDSFGLLKKCPFTAPQTGDLVCPWGKGRVVFAVWPRDRECCGGSRFRRFGDKSADEFVPALFISERSEIGGGDEKNRYWKHTETEVTPKRKEQTFYSWFDREIPDVLKSVSEEEKKRFKVFTFSENQCSFV